MGAIVFISPRKNAHLETINEREITMSLPGNGGWGRGYLCTSMYSDSQFRDVWSALLNSCCLLHNGRNEKQDSEHV